MYFFYMSYAAKNIIFYQSTLCVLLSGRYFKHRSLLELTKTVIEALNIIPRKHYRVPWAVYSDFFFFFWGGVILCSMNFENSCNKSPTRLHYTVKPVLKTT